MSLLKQLAASSMESALIQDEAAAQAAAIEQDRIEEEASAEIIELSDSIDSEVEVMVGMGDEVARDADSISNGLVTVGSIEDVVDSTIAAYGPDGIDEQGAELLRVSVESILRVSGLDMPVSMIVPSFESGMTRTEYSTEAEEKKKGVLSTIWAWLSKAFESIIDAVTGFFSRFGSSVGSVEKYIGKVKTKVDGLKGEPKGGVVKFAGSTALFIGSGSPDSNIKAAITSFQKFSQTWGGAWQKMTELSVGGNVDKLWQDIQAAVRGYASNGASHLKDLTPVPTHTLAVTNGSNKEYPLIGAKLKVTPKAKEGKGEMKALSISDMKSGITAAEAAVTAMKKITETTNKWISSAKKVSSWARGQAANSNMGAQMSSNVHQRLQFATQRDLLRTLVSANTLMSSGWAQAAPLVLKTVKANVVYIDRCAGKGGDGKAPELKTVNVPAGQKALGNDKSDKTGKTGNTFDH